MTRSSPTRWCPGGAAITPGPLIDKQEVLKALEIVERDGVDRLERAGPSMLGVKWASLYYHFEDKGGDPRWRRSAKLALVQRAHIQIATGVGRADRGVVGRRRSHASMRHPNLVAPPVRSNTN